jgi:branched-chain amino acid transport system substrate-binding protein
VQIHSLIRIFFGLAVVAFATSQTRAENGVTPDEIVFGQVAALDGSAAALGQGMRDGLQAAFSAANQAGGVKGRKMELISADDGYEPTKSVAAARGLIDGGKVLALIGSVGTPTSAAIQPLATEAGIPFIGALTGAEFLRDASKSGVINVRASYFQETEMMVERLTKDLGVAHIAIFYQDDAYGQAGLAGVKRALDKRGMTLAAEGTYERNTTAVKGALLAIRKAAPDAVIMIGAYQPTAEFIKLARQVKFAPTFVSISFVGADALAKEVGPAGAGVIVTEVVPFPGDTSIGLVANYQAALKTAQPDARPGFVSLEGYVVGRFIVAALEKIPGDITRQALIEAVMKTGHFDLGGVTLTYGAGDNRGSSQVFLTVIQPDGSLKPVDTLPKISG